MKAERNVHGDGDRDAERKYGDAEGKLTLGNLTRGNFTRGNSARNRLAETARVAPGDPAEETRQAEVPALLRPKVKASPWLDRR